MPDTETTTTQTTGQDGQQSTTTESQGQEAQVQQEKFYTQAEFNRATAAIRRNAEAEAKKAAEDAAKKAAMDETERARVEREEAIKRADESDARAIRAERRAELAGQVTSPEKVLKLIGSETEKYFSEDGKPNLEAIYTDFPEYKPATPSKEPAGGFNSRQGSQPNRTQLMQEALKTGNTVEYIRLSQLRD
jgi:hypothetical protein